MAGGGAAEAGAAGAAGGGEAGAGPASLEDRLLAGLAEHQTLVPEELAEKVLGECGVRTSDPRVAKLLAFATQHFIASVVHDAREVERRRRTLLTQRSLEDLGFDLKDKRQILTMEDLAQALEDYGITLKGPNHFADKQ